MAEQLDTKPTNKHGQTSAMGTCGMVGPRGSGPDRHLGRTVRVRVAYREDGAWDTFVGVYDGIVTLALGRTLLTEDFLVFSIAAGQRRLVSLTQEGMRWFVTDLRSDWDPGVPADWFSRVADRGEPAPVAVPDDIPF